MNIKNSIKETIGGTPLVRAVKTNDTRADILLKVESFNPSGSVKDRAALFMLEDAKKRGLIKEGGTIIEPTSGNTGIGLAMLAAADGFKAVFVMPVLSYPGNFQIPKMPARMYKPQRWKSGATQTQV